jgi:hypothetical protein
MVVLPGLSQQLEAAGKRLLGCYFSGWYLRVTLTASV